MDDNKINIDSFFARLWKASMVNPNDSNKVTLKEIIKFRINNTQETNSLNPNTEKIKYSLGILTTGIIPLAGLLYLTEKLSLHILKDGSGNYNYGKDNFANTKLITTAVLATYLGIFSHIYVPSHEIGIKTTNSKIIKIMTPNISAYLFPFINGNSKKLSEYQVLYGDQVCTFNVDQTISSDRHLNVELLYVEVSNIDNLKKKEIKKIKSRCRTTLIDYLV